MIRIHEHGLSSSEAQERLRRDGPNALPPRGRRGPWGIALEVIREPMFAMLVAGAALYLALGEIGDGLLLLAAVVMVISLTLYHEQRTDRALEALAELSSPRARVIRDGIEQRIPGTAVVVGDIVIVTEGDRVPADAVLRRATHLAVDESLLTGESVPVVKQPSLEVTRLEPAGTGEAHALYCGTLVTAGRGLCEVVRTGTHTEMARIGRALATIAIEPTRLQRETQRVVRWLAIAALLASVMVALVYASTRGGDAYAWKEGGLAGIAMAMSMLPEEFPVVLTVFLALGGWRLARAEVLTRRVAAIEALGAATVLCVDKTGTLTQNHMTLTRIVAGAQEIDLATDAPLPGEFLTVLKTAVRASQPDAVDPMEHALVEAATRLECDAHTAWQTLKEYPLTSARPMVAWVGRDTLLGTVSVCAKGAPETVAEACRLGPQAHAQMQQAISSMAAHGLRVLAVASADIAGADIAGADVPGADFLASVPLQFLGLIAFVDPLRPEVPDAVAACRSAGIRVVMITGDYPVTAAAIARDAGLARPQTTLTGSELDALDDAELAQRVSVTDVFARIRPEQKLRLVNAFKRRGEVVAMTGDGVNDAPALKSADIGIAMGRRGTDVAREAADLVLLDDAFSSIVTAVQLGRRIHDNIRKASVFILAVHVPIAGLSMIPVLSGYWPLLLLPVHIVFLEFIIDPACAMVFEGERAEPGVMRRPPRDPQARLFSTRMVATGLLQGAAILGGCLGVFLWLYGDGSHAAASAGTLRATIFITLVTAVLALILVNRSWTESALAMLRERNTAFAVVSVASAALLAIALGVPAVSSLFSFEAVSTHQALGAIAVGSASVLWFEAIKRWLR